MPLVVAFPDAVLVVAAAGAPAQAVPGVGCEAGGQGEEGGNFARDPERPGSWAVVRSSRRTLAADAYVAADQQLPQSRAQVAKVIQHQSHYRRPLGLFPAEACCQERLGRRATSSA